MHIQELPLDSATVRAHTTPEMQWKTTHELLAVLIEAVQWQTVNLVRTWGNEMNDPTPILRPGQERPEPPQQKTVSLSEWASTL